MLTYWCNTEMISKGDYLNTENKYCSQSNENSSPGFFMRHKVLFKGVVLYILGYILSNLLPPWVLLDPLMSIVGLKGYGGVLDLLKDEAAGGFISDYMPDLLSDNHLFKIIPLDIVYYGFADIAAAVHYGAYIPLGLVTFATLRQDRKLEKKYKDMEYYPDDIERRFNSYLYCNAMFYPLSIVIVAFQGILEYVLFGADFVSLFVDSSFIPEAAIPFLSAIIIAAVLIFTVLYVLYFGLPIIINVLYFFLYGAVAFVVCNITELVYQLLLSWMPIDIVRELLSFILAAAVLLKMNLLLEELLEKTWKIALIPSEFVTGLLRKLRSHFIR